MDLNLLKSIKKKTSPLDIPLPSMQAYIPTPPEIVIPNMQDMNIEELEGFDNKIDVDKFVLTKMDATAEPCVQNLPYKISLLKRPDGSIYCTIIITGYIDYIDQWVVAEKVLDRLTERDVVSMFICSPGGAIAGGMCLIAAMNNCKAFITTIGMGMIASMGSAIWMYGDKLLAMPLCQIMYHMSSGMTMGNSLMGKHENGEIAAFMNDVYFRRALKLGILTPEEVDNIHAIKQDVYITAEEFNRRMAAKGEN